MAWRLRLAMVMLCAPPAASTSFAQSGPAWHWENAPPLRKTIRDVWRAGDRVIAVGEQGAVVRSTDGGATWNGRAAGARLSDKEHGGAASGHEVVMRECAQVFSGRLRSFRVFSALWKARLSPGFFLRVIVAVEGRFS